MMIMGRCGIACALLLAAVGAARADDAITTMDRQWPGLPEYRGLSLEDQITDHLSEIGNMIGGHIDLLSHDMIGLHVNGRAQRAQLRLGGGNVRYLSFRIDSDWLFADGKARISAKLDLGVAGRMLHVELPDMEMIPDSYHGAQLVQVNVPLLERRF